MKSLIKSIKGLPLIVKLILALPGLDIFWNVYRTMRSLAKDNLIGVILGILLIFVGWSFLWVIDLITILLKGDVLWIN